MNTDYSSIVRIGTLMLIMLLLTACDGSRTEAEVVVTGKTMGTTYQVKVVGGDVDVSALKEAIDNRLVELNDVFSTYIPESEISRLNQRQDDEPVQVSEDMRALLRLSKRIYGISGGAFDVTVGPLVNLWGFGPDGPVNGVPTQERIDDVLAEIGFDRLTLAGSNVTAPSGLVIDMSAIAKGFAVDEISDYLKSRGLTRFMVEIGGEVSGAGLNSAGRAWRIGVETPDRQIRKLHKVLPLLDLGMATSGDYRNFFVHEDIHYSHTLNPVTGWPVTHNMASVTVLHASTAFADAIATAFSVLGPEQTMAIAKAQNLAVFAILRTDTGYRELTSDTLKMYLESVSEYESN